MYTYQALATGYTMAVAVIYGGGLLSLPSRLPLTLNHETVFGAAGGFFINVWT